MTCAASPARKTRPARKDEAVDAAALHGWTLPISIGKSAGAPSAVRTKVAQRSAERPSETWLSRAPFSSTVANTARKPASPVIEKRKKASRSGRFHIDHAEIARADHRPHVRPEIDGRAIREAAAALHVDAERLAHRAVGAVGRDQVAGADRPFGAAVARAQGRRHSVLVLREAGQLGREEMLGAERGGAGAQHRLEPDLGDEQTRGGAQAFDAVVERAVEAGELASAQRIDRDDRAILDELPRRRFLDRRLDAKLRKISIVRWWKEAARGWIAVPRCRSTSRCGTSCAASKAEAVSPTRLPPAIRTGTSGSAITSPSIWPLYAGRLYQPNSCLTQFVN